MDKQTEDTDTGITRRDLVRGGALIAGSVVVAASMIAYSKTAKKTTDTIGDKSIRSLPEFKTVTIDQGNDILIRMQDELRAAMKKPVEQRKWQMVIDTRKCVGCHACTVACIAENKLPPGVVYRPVIQELSGKYPLLSLRYFPRPCMQCELPPCTEVCPVKATWKRPDGIVVIDYDKCIGCRYCLSACPYGARTSDFNEKYTENTPRIQPYELAANNEYGKAWNRKDNNSPVGNARKCHFCLHRIEVGLLPQCVSTCIGRANYFGDASDAETLVSQMAAKTNKITLLEAKGTRPQVIYLI
ncbi:4Fe-4S dicluster domain-containing protein [Candidatus Magnetobacterium casense]|uniref:4Fe-4S dicluster domain-containing protein n=1 Tax=Candidatus Magnetobacterium casense TaxID=1455061 RepID=A0ABS6RZJ1_9BACT|nr:4Fe-4S dicluster domain-containing protein [Candidatus Magnetobacterium casensis]MBV6341439.1 4Fe-4S dicluster domain-containing protein [Candidatus Magnetobacterium casensis]